MLVLTLDEAHGHPGDGRADRHASIHQGQSAAAYAGHGCGPVGTKDFGDQPDSVGELVLSGNHRAQGPLRKSAVADRSTARRAQSSHLSHAERREIVVVHEALRLLQPKAVEHLLLALGAKGRDCQDLGLATREEAGAVRAG